MPRILLADDQKDMLQTIQLILGDDFKVVGMVENGLNAVELADTLAPDVVVLDISMPVLNGIQAACRLKEKGSSARILVLSMHTDPEFVEAALSAGALGYVVKACLATDLVPAIWSVMHDDVFISPVMHIHG